MGIEGGWRGSVLVIMTCLFDDGNDQGDVDYCLMDDGDMNENLLLTIITMKLFMILIILMIVVLTMVSIIRETITMITTEMIITQS